MPIEFKIVEAGDFDDDRWFPLPPDDADHEHDWQPVWSTNFAGRAYRCEICWDRTD